MLKRLLIPCLLLVSGNQSMAAEPDYEKCLRAIDQEIAALGQEFPQLKAYPETRTLDLKSLTITYQFHTHSAPLAGGWSSGVPNPDADGIWFLLDFHDPDSPLQLHRQPIISTVMPIGKKRAFLLILEGAQTRAASGHIWNIVKRVAKQ